VGAEGLVGGGEGAIVQCRGAGVQQRLLRGWVWVPAGRVW
jgi:hypothetical protein